jgi:hypothetical protein
MDFSKTDIIVVNTVDQDFPLFRKFLIDNHHHFNKVYYVFTHNEIEEKTNQVDYYNKYNYSETVMKSMPFANYVWVDQNQIHKWRTDGRISDFRDQATNVALDVSKSEDVLFLEPDVLLGNIDYLLNLPNDLDMIAHCEDSSYRLSPSFIWTKRKYIDNTLRWFVASSKPLFDNMVKFTMGPDVNLGCGNFGPQSIPIKDRYYVKTEKIGADHFDKFSSEVFLQCQNPHFINHRSFEFFHMGGVYQTMWQMRAGNYKNVYDFTSLGPYLEKCLKSNVVLDPKYVNEINTHLPNMRKHQPW